MDLTYIIIWGFFGIVLIGLLLFWLSYRSYDYQVRIRQVTGTKVKLIADGVGKIKKDEDRVEYLSLFNKVCNLNALPLPPNEAIDYNPKKKRKVVEAWYDEENGITYINDDGKALGFQPLTTKQRSMFVNQIRKKEARKVKKWTDNIPLIAGLTTLVLIIVVVLLFWGEAIKPIQAAAQTSNEALDKANELWSKIIAFERGEQNIGGDPIEIPPGA